METLLIVLSAACLLVSLVVLVWLMTQAVRSRNLFERLTEMEKNLQEQSLNNLRKHEEQAAKIRTLVEDARKELQALIEKQIEHTQQKHAQEMADLQKVLSDRIDRLENFLREPIL